MIPLILVILITLEVYPSFSPDPLSSNPRKALVTKKMENVLILYRSAQESNDSLSNRAWPSVEASLRSRAEAAELSRNVDTGPTWPALCHVSEEEKMSPDVACDRLIHEDMKLSLFFRYYTPCFEDTVFVCDIHRQSSAVSEIHPARRNKYSYGIRAPFEALEAVSSTSFRLPVM
jgi:hypothetical protein